MATRPLNPHAIPINTRANHFIQAASCVIIVRAITQSIIVKNFYHCPVKTKLLKSTITSKVKASLRLIISEVFLWTDSTIVLAWIQTPPNLLKTFVANRIAQIQDLTNGNSWRHVPTSSNAADPLSRGMSAQELTRSELWWRGPEWLAKNSDYWPASVTNNMKALPELRTSNQACISVARINFVAIENFSSFPKLQRVVAYCQRFIHNCRMKEKYLSKCLTPQEVVAYCQRFIHNCRMKEKYLSKCLTPQELFNATMLIVKVVQSESFSQELKDIRGTDEQGLLRVGGRLKHSDLPYETKHPVTGINPRLLLAYSWTRYSQTNCVPMYPLL
ncbi:hypothetical protein QE152_g1368 [Popillia japonica]|uniref:Uncharacterized protein n=1 Tax=Popillia japonica TaxID=7064 RepID=A0AAW1N313_POPJA